MAKKTQKKKTKAIVKKIEKKLMWAGAKAIMGKPTTPKEEVERKWITLASRVLNISPFGVNILGNLPYINKLGLMQKAKQYNKGVEFKYEWIKTSQDDTDKAVCKCKIVIGPKELTDWIIGECSPSSMKMSTLKGYQNHMAQTRARNRAILEAFGVKIHEEMMENIARLYTKKEITEQEAVKIGEATKTSVEELQLPLSIQSAPGATKSEKSGTKVEELKGMLKGNTIAEKLADLKKRTGIALGSFNITDKHSSVIIAGILNQEVKK
ncbi:MAG: hypothetical protein ACKKMS_00010 [Candidatus Nealsonbacteria bacterium]